MPLPLVLATPTIVNGVAIATTAIAIGYQINQSLQQDIGLPSSSASGLPESPVWDGRSTGTGLLDNQLADSRRQALRDTYQPLVGSPPLTPPSQSAPKSSIVPTPRAAERVQDRLSPQLGSINDLFTQGQAFVNSIAATIPSPNNQKFPNFGFPNPFSFGNQNEDNGYYQDISRVDSQTPQRIYTPPFRGGQSVGILYRVQYRAVTSTGQPFVQHYADMLGAFVGVRAVPRTTGSEINKLYQDYFLYNSAGQQFGTGATRLITDPLTFTFTVARLDGLDDTGGDIPDPNPIATAPLSPPPVYPDAQEWPYRNVNAKVGGVASSPILQLPQSFKSPEPETKPLPPGVVPFVRPQPQPEPQQLPEPDPEPIPRPDPDPAPSPDPEPEPTQIPQPEPQKLPDTEKKVQPIPFFLPIPSEFPSESPSTSPSESPSTSPSTSPSRRDFGFPVVIPSGLPQYQSGSQVYPSPASQTQAQTQNTTPQQQTELQTIINQLSGVSNLASGVSSQVLALATTAQVTGVSSLVSGVSGQVSGVSSQVSALPTIPQIAATTATAICEQSAPDGCIDNSNKRNKPSSGEQVSITIQEFDKCENGGAVFKTKTIQVLKGTEQQAQELFKQISEIEGQKCTLLTSVTTFPDSWAGKVEDDRPQAVIYYREWDGSKFGNYTHSICIPWYSKPKGYKPSLPTIKKGSFFGILKFKDNSQIYVNCESINEAKRVINALKPLSGIKSKGARLKLGEYGDGTLKRVTTKAVRLDFYSKGRTNAVPDWNVSL